MPKITVSKLRRLKQEHTPVVMLTAYDAPTAAMAEKCGIDMLLVGDSVGMAQLGYKTTIPVTLEESLHHCRAVTRGARETFVVGDMPFMTYQVSPEQALVNAARYMQEAGCDAVKLEGGAEVAHTVERLVLAGVPVMCHIGLRPQHVFVEGGYKIAGKTDDAADELLKSAKMLQDAGAFSVVLECVPAAVAKKITDSLAITTIGIGAGNGCDGQVQVVNDILGLFTDFLPKHAKRYAELSPLIEKAFRDYSGEVRSRAFPDAEHSH